MTNGEHPLSPELLTERLARLAEDLPQIRDDLAEIKAGQTSQVVVCARTSSSVDARLQAVEHRVAAVEDDVGALRKRVNGWNLGNTILASVGTFLATIGGN